MTVGSLMKIMEGCEWNITLMITTINIFEVLTMSVYNKWVVGILTGRRSLIKVIKSAKD